MLLLNSHEKAISRQIKYMIVKISIKLNKDDVFIFRQLYHLVCHSQIHF